MDTTLLKSFATSARTELIREVGARITAVLAPGSPERVEQPSAVTALERAIAGAGGGDAGKAQAADKVAYTWFNRIIALRFMDANHYTGIGVVSPAADQVGQPEVLAAAKRGQVDVEVVKGTNAATVTGLLNGTRQSRSGVDAQAEAYALLLADYCRYWNRSMPFMFEREGDYTELLIPANLLAEDSVLSRSVRVLSEDVCRDVEVIGWLYQFYISERKDEVFAGFKKNEKARAEDIPAATQIFTPHWIVRYLVENSLGRVWMLNHPDSQLAEKMEYYIPPVDEETDFLKITKPEELTVIDPACGSGHMLTYAFDLLYAIYEEEGYTPSQIPSLILTNNLYGTEIDPRAGALAAFALTMKAAARRKLFLRNPVAPNVCVLEPITFTPDELGYLVTKEGDRQSEEAFWNQFAEADTFGSLIQPDPALAAHLVGHLTTFDDEGDLFRADALGRAKRVLTMAKYLTTGYSVLVANPPYMGSGNMGDQLAQFAGRYFKVSKYDLYAMFIERSFGLLAHHGYSAMVTMESWMTGAVYAKFRAHVIFEQDLRSLVHMPYLGKGRTAMGINFGITAMVQRKALGGSDRAMFQCVRHFELDDFGVPHTFPVHNERVASLKMDEFARIPGKPVIYAASHDDLDALAFHPKISDLLGTREGLTTGDNDRFLRRWFEVSNARISSPRSAREESRGRSAPRWYMYVKGGEFRRWYGNIDFVVDWESDGARVKANVDVKTGRVRSHNYNGDYAFREGLTWSGVSSSKFSARYVPAGHMFDAKGPMGFGRNRTDLLAALAILNSGTADRFLGMLAPNLDFKLGHVLSLPIPEDESLRIELSHVAENAVEVSKALWDEAETSWDFSRSPLMRREGRLVVFLEEVASERQALSTELESLRTRVDQIVLLGRNETRDFRPGDVEKIDAEVPPIPTGERIKDLVSYAVGCMFGRYSLDETGLILADQGVTLEEYLAKVPVPTFKPDADNVIPIVDGDWFEDDVVERFRQFLRATFGEQHFEENLQLVTTSLGVKRLRDYFVKSFYKDHVQRYKKRPIYWLFSSPKGSFNALIYMHRYTPSTVSTVLTYLREYVTKLESTLQQAERAGNAKEADRLRKILVELNEYEHDTLFPKASENVAIDLDDGVKTNYPKFGAALKKIAGLEAASD
ncbi:BREX-1 system adenine-specific DNA-methyltransferase PglX [Microbacterium sp. A204]|uniref:BREX-1 system adenine-specific DNA-methyltransferase PglX n=1 Tax=Microbacterium sp. A204 TaxID=3457321 RepID=UPI003FCEFAC1